MGSRFFNPKVGANYSEGFTNFGSDKKGKKLLVLGASFYCAITDCEFYSKCTGYDYESYRWQTEDFNELCNVNGKKYIISDSPTTELDFYGARSYKRFTQLLYEINTGKHYNEMYEDDFFKCWDHAAFTNYVQHMIGGRTTTRPSDISETDMEAFLETLDELKPDVVIVWGCVVNEPIRNLKSISGEPDFLNDFQEGSDGYVFHWIYKGRKITFLNIYHPSSGTFYTDNEWYEMKRLLSEILDGE